MQTFESLTRVIKHEKRRQLERFRNMLNTHTSTIMYVYVLSSLLWCLLRFPHENDVFTSSCL